MSLPFERKQGKQQGKAWWGKGGNGKAVVVRQQGCRCGVVNSGRGLGGLVAGRVVFSVLPPLGEEEGTGNTGRKVCRVGKGSSGRHREKEAMEKKEWHVGG